MNQNLTLVKALLLFFTQELGDLSLVVLEDSFGELESTSPFAQDDSVTTK